MNSIGSLGATCTWAMKRPWSMLCRVLTRPSVTMRKACCGVRPANAPRSYMKRSSASSVVRTASRSRSSLFSKVQAMPRSSATLRSRIISRRTESCNNCRSSLNVWALMARKSLGSRRIMLNWSAKRSAKSSTLKAGSRSSTPCSGVLAGATQAWRSRSRAAIMPQTAPSGGVTRSACAVGRVGVRAVSRPASSAVTSQGW